jgi:hypothetical protein
MKAKLAVASAAVVVVAVVVLTGVMATGGERVPATTRPVDPRIAQILEAARRTPNENLVRVFVVGQSAQAATAPVRELSGDGDWLVLRMARGAPETYVNISNITHITFIMPGAGARTGTVGGRNIRDFIPPGVDLDDLDLDDDDFDD